MPEPTLICLPPAGAGPGLFRPWQGDGAAVLAPSLPGREARFREAAPETLEARANILAGELAQVLPRRYGLFGYSMGGTLAWLLACRLVARGLPGPERLFVLGALPPDMLADSTARIHGLDSATFWAEIARIGGTPPEILGDADLRALFEPLLRQDFGACARHRPQPDAPRLACPAEVLVAADDHLIEAGAAAAGWARFSTGPVRLHRLAGGHMLDAPAFAALGQRLRALWAVPEA